MLQEHGSLSRQLFYNDDIFMNRLLLIDCLINNDIMPIIEQCTDLNGRES
jgi:hypothetical protein